MKGCITGVSIVILAFAALCLAQAPGKVPGPGPEHKRLNSFAGTWTSEGEMKPSPFGPGGKFSGKSRVEWLPGEFFLVMHEESKSPMGDMKGLAVFGYDAQKKVYTYNGFDNMGNAETYTGTVQGQTWTWTSDIKLHGKAMKGRFILTEVTPTSNTMKFEFSENGGPWQVTMEGKQTKVK